MINKKLIALFVTILSIGAISARYRDGVVENTAEATGNVAATAADVPLGIVGPLFGGRNVEERIEDRQDRRDARQMRKQQIREEADGRIYEINEDYYE